MGQQPRCGRALQVPHAPDLTQDPWPRAVPPLLPPGRLDDQGRPLSTARPTRRAPRLHVNPLQLQVWHAGRLPKHVAMGCTPYGVQSTCDALLSRPVSFAVFGVPLSMHMRSAGSSTAAAVFSRLLSQHELVAGPALLQVSEPASADVKPRLKSSLLPRRPLSMIQMRERRCFTQ